MKRRHLPEPREYVLIRESAIRWELLTGLSLLAEHPQFPKEVGELVKDLFRKATELPDGKLTENQVTHVLEEARRCSWDGRVTGKKDAELLAGCVMMVLHSPNNRDAKPHIFEMEDTGDTLTIVKESTGETP